MIGKLSGILETIENEWIILDVSGVGYLIFISDRTRTQLPTLGASLQLFIETHVREDHIRLYGFTSSTEKTWFQTLQTVQGVGAKVALTLLSTFSPHAIAEAVLGETHLLLTRAPGVGPKVASRIVRELKDKVPYTPDLKTDTAPLDSAIAKDFQDNQTFDARTSLHKDVLSALMNLGYSTLHAQGALRTALEKTTHETSSLNLEELLRLALQHCAKI
jgi:Holliday junction DNA helicase RuvA